MADRPIDAERIAALIDGRLTPAERSQLLAQIAESDEWRDVLAEAAVVVHDDAGSDQAVVDARATSRRWTPWLLVAAAAMLGVAVLRGAGENTADPAFDRLAMQVATLDVSVEELRAINESRWSVVRSSSIDLSHEARSVRLGALAVDALLDREAHGLDARQQMIALLQSEAGASPLIQLLNLVADSASLLGALHATRELVNHDAFDAGAWLQRVRAGDSDALSDASGAQAVRRRMATASMPVESAASMTALLDSLEVAATNDHGSSARSVASHLLRKLAE